MARWIRLWPLGAGVLLVVGYLCFFCRPAGGQDGTSIPPIPPISPTTFEKPQGPPQVPGTPLNTTAQAGNAEKEIESIRPVVSSKGDGPPALISSPPLKLIESSPSSGPNPTVPLPPIATAGPKPMQVEQIIPSAPIPLNLAPEQSTVNKLGNDPNSFTVEQILQELKEIKAQQEALTKTREKLVIVLKKKLQEQQTEMQKLGIIEPNNQMPIITKGAAIGAYHAESSRELLPLPKEKNEENNLRL